MTCLNKIHFNEFLLLLSQKDVINESNSVIKLIEPKSSNKEKDSILILLNSDSMEVSIAYSFWSYFSSVFCADGGANKLYDGAISESTREKFIPNYIKGDLDSLRDDVRDYYCNKRTKIILDSNQDHNDLEKCLQEVYKNYSTLEAMNISIVILGAFGGRFDQEISNIHALFRWQNKFYRIILMGHDNIAFLLEPGLHTIIPVNEMEGKKCGILPLGEKVNKVTTTGLKWNLDNQEINLGSFISTSNEIMIPSEIINNDMAENYNKVTIETSGSIIWTCSFEFKI